MFLKRGLITNVGKHRRLDLHFKLGLIGIFGPNGSGKSTIMDLLWSSITGDFSRLPGNKEDNINLLAGDKEESSCYWLLEHEGVDIELYRAFRAPRGTPLNSLTVASKTFTKAPEIKTELERRLGVNMQLITAYAWVPQREMFSFMSQTSGERAAAYQKLCRTEKANVIHAQIGKMMEQDRDLLLPGVVDNSDELRQRIGGLILQQEQAKLAYNVAGSALLPPEKKNLAESYIRKDQASQFARQQINEVQIRRSNRVETLAAAKASKEDWERLSAMARELLQTLKQQADDARGSLGQLAQFKKTEASRRSLMTNLESAQKLLSTRLAPSLSPRDAEYAKIVTELTANRRRLEEAKKIVATFDRSGVVECPTCQTPVANLADYLNELKQLVATLPAAIAEQVRVTDAIVAARMEQTTYKDWLSGQNTLVDSLTAQLGLLHGAAPVITDEDSLKQAIQDYEIQTAHANKAGTELAAATKKLFELEAADNADARQLTQAQALLTENSIPEANVAAAKKALDRHRQAEIDRATTGERFQQLTASLKADQAALDLLAARIERSQKAINFVKKLTAIRDVFHPAELPKVVAQANLRSTEGDINKGLESFGSPFWVKASDDLLFTVHFPGLPPMNADRLSCGLKGVLAVNFRNAVNSLFGADIGMMSMDEPTADMDEQNVNLLAGALGRYAQQIRGKRQVFMITHAKSLQSSFDQVVDLATISQ